MKRMKIIETLKSKKFAAGCAAVALALVIGSVAMVQESSKIPELPSYTDPILEVSIEDEETPLAAAPKVTSKTSKKTTKKNVKLKTAATKTYTKKLPTVKKTTSNTQNKTNETVKTQTTVLTDTSEKYTKKSKVKAVTTTVTTTVVTTTTAKTASSTGGTALTSGTKAGKYEAAVANIAPMMDSRVISAYNKLGFKVIVDSSVTYAGHFDAKTRTITVRSEDDTIYHELGHFLAFISGNSDQTSSFLSVYNLEKSKFTGVNKAYATQNSAEYFAESVKDYIVQPAALKSARPQTYQAITEALNKMTDAQVTKVQTLYAPVWK
ncbi:MAG: hypothetical protein Q4D16_10440 [Eubacteriales bacterium]|nr:hypothetical protein [Eubacteriales bacterium]